MYISDKTILLLIAFIFSFIFYRDVTKQACYFAYIFHFPLITPENETKLYHLSLDL